MSEPEDTSLIEQAKDLQMLGQMMREDQAKATEHERAVSAWWRSVMHKRDTP